MDNEFDKDVSINPEALDVEWLRQPRLVAKYSEALASAKESMTRAKDSIDVVKAEVDGELRAGFAADAKKPTEAAIAAMVLQAQSYQDANEAYLVAKRRADMVQAAVTALDHKKAALENLVRLFGQNYFAGPREPRDLGVEWNKQLTQTGSRMEGDADQAIKQSLLARRGGEHAEVEQHEPRRRRRAE